MITSSPIFSTFSGDVLRGRQLLWQRGKPKSLLSYRMLQILFVDLEFLNNLGIHSIRWKPLSMLGSAQFQCFLFYLSSLFLKRLIFFIKPWPTRFQIYVRFSILLILLAWSSKQGNVQESYMPEKSIYRWTKPKSYLTLHYPASYEMLLESYIPIISPCIGKQECAEKECSSTEKGGPYHMTRSRNRRLGLAPRISYRSNSNQKHHSGRRSNIAVFLSSRCIFNSQYRFFTASNNDYLVSISREKRKATKKASGQVLNIDHPGLWYRRLTVSSQISPSMLAGLTNWHRILQAF